MPRPSFLFLIFLKFLCQESFLCNQIGFLDAHGGHCTTTVYIHYMFFFLCNLILENSSFCCFMLKMIDFCAFEFLSCCY
jgi:hypothetical protein